MKRFWKLYRVEQALFFRSADVFIFNLCMPVVTLMLIGWIAGEKPAGSITYLQNAFAALTSVGICCRAFMSRSSVSRLVSFSDFFFFDKEFT